MSLYKQLLFFHRVFKCVWITCTWVSQHKQTLCWSTPRYHLPASLNILIRPPVILTETIGLIFRFYCYCFFFNILKHVTVELPFALNVLRCVFFFFFLRVFGFDMEIRQSSQKYNPPVPVLNSITADQYWSVDYSLWLKKCLNLCQNEKGICLWKNIDFSPC